MITSPKIQAVLELIGLDEREQKIYLAVLESGETLQLPLAKKIGIQRTSLRELLPDLIKRGILKESVRGKRKYLVGENPQTLVRRLTEQAKLAEESLPELTALQNQLQNKPRVFFYEGIAGVKQIYNLTLETGQTIRSFVDVSRIHPEIASWLSGEYTRQREEKKINALNIVYESSELKSVMPKESFRQNKIISRADFPFEMEILVFGDYVAYIHFRKNEEPSAVLIQSQSAAVTMSSIHRAMWK